MYVAGLGLIRKNLSPIADAEPPTEPTQESHPMSRSRFSLILAVLAALTVWGCSQSGSSTTSAAAKATRLQEEVQNMTTQRDQLRQDLKSAQAERDRLQDEVMK